MQLCCAHLLLTMRIPGPQREPPTSGQCYQAMQEWCSAGRKKKADMPDKGTVMMPRPQNSFSEIQPRTTRLTVPCKGNTQLLGLALQSTGTQAVTLAPAGSSLSTIM